MHTTIYVLTKVLKKNEHFHQILSFLQPCKIAVYSKMVMKWPSMTCCKTRRPILGYFVR